MTNTLAFQGKMKEKGFTVANLAKQVSLSATGLLNKIHNIREFRASEILALSDILELNLNERENIFFAKRVEFNSTE